MFLSYLKISFRCLGSGRDSRSFWVLLSQFIHSFFLSWAQAELLLEDVNLLGSKKQNFFKKEKFSSLLGEHNQAAPKTM